MAVQVLTREDGTDTYLGATKWHIDQTGALHIIKGESDESDTAGPFAGLPAGNVASYPAGRWDWVRQIPDVNDDAVGYIKAITGLLALGAISEETANQAAERTIALVAEVGKGARHDAH